MGCWAMLGLELGMSWIASKHKSLCGICIEGWRGRRRVVEEVAREWKLVKEQKSKVSVTRFQKTATRDFLGKGVRPTRRSCAKT